MFTDNLPFASFIQPHLELMKFISSILIIILMIAALAGGGCSGVGTYFELISAIIIGIVMVGVGHLYKQ